MTKVLVVDDEAPIRLLCRVNLEAEGIEVVEADDGLEGVEQARVEQPDVILLDVMMPRLDGWGAAELLLHDPATKEIPIVFLTARAEAWHEERALDLGGLDFVKKPFNPLELAPLVRAVLASVRHGRGDERRHEKLAQLRSLLGA